MSNFVKAIRQKARKVRGVCQRRKTSNAAENSTARSRSTKNTSTSNNSAASNSNSNNSSSGNFNRSNNSDSSATVLAPADANKVTIKRLEAQLQQQWQTIQQLTDTAAAAQNCVKSAEQMCKSVNAIHAQKLEMALEAYLQETAPELNRRNNLYLVAQTNARKAKDQLAVSEMRATVAKLERDTLAERVRAAEQKCDDYEKRAEDAKDKLEIFVKRAQIAGYLKEWARADVSNKNAPFAQRFSWLLANILVWMAGGDVLSASGSHSNPASTAPVSSDHLRAYAAAAYAHETLDYTCDQLEGLERGEFKVFLDAYNRCDGNDGISEDPATLLFVNARPQPEFEPEWPQDKSAYMIGANETRRLSDIDIHLD